MNNIEAEKRINRYILYIENDAQNKIKDIDSKIEEEYNMEKGSQTQTQCLAILNHYGNKEKNLDLQLKFAYSQLKSNAKIAILTSKDHSINEILKEVGQKLKKKNKDVEVYKGILEKLILQGMLALLDKNVTLGILKEDKDVIKEVIPKAEQKYKEMTGLETKADVDPKRFLPDSRLGGVEVYGSSDTVKVCNTFEARIELLREKASPYIRLILYGPNSNRTFTD
ncbi:unnamed protein product [Brassicogethes aeneus]|uniref:Uncharacterized protein n=1 Tax=Brassicogethes aeneus TaxID=1431903 RepID=A0A9P0B1I5_BRAAE|nr:unnamed protein product [Brassicogethes aeneus]